jgi:hypothetical protein
METKFIIEPHAADYTYPGASPDYFFNCMSVCEKDGLQVAIIPMDNPNWEKHLKLIAAAPELLEAVKRLMILYCPLNGVPTSDELVEHWEYEKSEGNGAADDMLFVLSVVKKAT